jgi:preprotein translocase subunit SecY
MTAFEGGRVNERTPSFGRRVVYTVLLLLLFRFLARIPLLNVSEDKLEKLLADNPLVGTVNLFAGGEVLTHFSLVAAGLVPYLLAILLVEWGALTLPPLKELRKQGESGKKRLDLYSKVLNIPLAFLFAWFLSRYLAQQVGLFPGQIRWFTAASFLPSLRIVCLVTLGSLISTYISDLITKKGIDSGENVILLSGASFALLTQLLHIARGAPNTLVAAERIAAVLGTALIVVVFSIYMIKSIRRVPLEYPRLSVPKKVSARSVPGVHIPLPLNSGRTRPITTAIGLLFLLQLGWNFTHAHLSGRFANIAGLLSTWATPGAGVYWLLLACLIVLFTYLFNFMLITSPFGDSEESVAESLKKQGAFIPGVRPGKATEKYLIHTVWFSTLPGAFGLALLAAGLPYVIFRITHLNVIVTILSLMVVVERVDRLELWVRSHTISYKGLLNDSAARKW